MHLSTAGVLFAVAAVRAAGPWTIAGKGPITATLSQASSGSLSLSCFHESSKQPVLTAGNIGVSTTAATFGPDYTFVNRKDSTPSESYTLSTGGNIHRSFTHSQSEFTFETNNLSLRLDVRVADDGCAFRYHLPAGMYNVTSEQTTWTIGSDGSSYVMDVVDTSWESEWVVSTSSKGNSVSMLQMPALFDVGSVAKSSSGAPVYIVLNEADLDGRYAGSSLTHANGSDTLTYGLTFTSGGVVVVNASAAGLNSPWRTAVIGDLATVHASTLEKDLSPASKIADPSWIKPGPSSWSWCMDHSSPFNVTILKTYVDMAQRQGWPYSLVDEGFPFDSGPSFCEYSKARNVGITVWFNNADWDTAEKRQTQISTVQSWGCVTGVKIDFFESDSQATHQEIEDILSATADAKLLTDLHGLPPPRGKQRTWPHLVTLEGIRGQEHSIDSTRDAIIPLTRNVGASMDYTPGIFTPPDGTDPNAYRAQASSGAQLAQQILYESGIQHVSEKPEVLENITLAARAVYALPTVWSSSALLDGSSPAEQLLISRTPASDDSLRYFAGITNNADAQTLTLPLGTLGSGTWFVDIVADDTSSADRGALKRITQKATSSESIKIDVKANGGFMGIACRNPGSDGCLHVF